MSTIPFQTAFAILKKTYKSVDVRAAILKTDKHWHNIVTVIRFSYYEKAEVRKILESLEGKFPFSGTDDFKIVTMILNIDDFSRIEKGLRNKRLTCSGYKIEFVNPIELDQLQFHFGGRTGRGGSPSRVLGPSGEMNYLYCEHAACESNNHLRVPDQVNADICASSFFQDVYEVINHRLEITCRSNVANGLIFYMPLYSAITDRDFDGSRVSAEIKSHIDINPTLDILILSRDRIESAWSFDLESSEPLEVRENLGTYKVEEEFPRITRQHRILFRLKHKEFGDIHLDEREINVESLMNRKDQLRNPLFSTLVQFCSEEDLRSHLLEPRSRKGKNPSDVFERAISWILAMNGFETIWLQDYEKLFDRNSHSELGSVDLIAYNPNVKNGNRHEKAFIFAECTTGSVELDKIDRLNETKRQLFEKVFSGKDITVLSIIFCSIQARATKGQAENSGVILLDRDDIEELIKTTKEGKAYRFIQKIGV